VTVHSSADECRPREAKRLMKYKHARSVTELQNEVKDYTDLFAQRPYLTIEEWGLADIGADVERLGLSGSPTKVKKVENIVFTQKDSVVIDSKSESIENLMKELIDSHVIG
jgi:electron transfer flavoprotein beta subunit